MKSILIGLALVLAVTLTFNIERCQVELSGNEMTISKSCYVPDLEPDNTGGVAIRGTSNDMLERFADLWLGRPEQLSKDISKGNVTKDDVKGPGIMGEPKGPGVRDFFAVRTDGPVPITKDGGTTGTYAASTDGPPAIATGGPVQEISKDRDGQDFFAMTAGDLNRKPTSVVPSVGLMEPITMPDPVTTVAAASQGEMPKGPGVTTVAAAWVLGGNKPSVAEGETPKGPGVRTGYAGILRDMNRPAADTTIWVDVGLSEMEPELRGEPGLYAIKLSGRKGNVTENDVAGPAITKDGEQSLFADLWLGRPEQLSKDGGEEGEIPCFAIKELLSGTGADPFTLISTQTDEDYEGAGYAAGHFAEMTADFIKPKDPSKDVEDDMDVVGKQNKPDNMFARFAYAGKRNDDMDDSFARNSAVPSVG